MRETPHAPWRLRGECIVGWARPPASLRSLLPDGLRPLPGPGALVGASYTDSPVGPYCEFAFCLPARLGLRPGLCVVLQIVSAPGARLGYRQNWGLPASLGPLSWQVEGDERVLRCEGPGFELRGIPGGPAVPVVIPMRSVQRRADGPVVLPRRIVALARMARAEFTVDAKAGPELVALAGHHRGVLLAGLRMVAKPARHPAGLLSSLRAPLRVLEPAIAGEPTSRVTSNRALSSAG